MSDSLVIGYDEAGWGSLAGPLVVAGVLLPDTVEISTTIKDSKKFNSEELRKKAYVSITENYVYDFRFVHPSDVKTAYLGNNCSKFADWGSALRSATGSVMANLKSVTSHLPNIKHIVDGNLTYGIEDLTAIPKADSTVAAVAAASIIAKVCHDDYMNAINTRVDFGFKNHKGYGTPEHIKALNQYGPIRGVHRENIDKVKKALKSKGWYK